MHPSSGGEVRFRAVSLFSFGHHTDTRPELPEKTYRYPVWRLIRDIELSPCSALEVRSCNCALEEECRPGIQIEVKSSHTLED